MKALKTATGGFYNDLISVRSPLETFATAASILETRTPTFAILNSITALILLLRLNILKSLI